MSCTRLSSNRFCILFLTDGQLDWKLGHEPLMGALLAERASLCIIVVMSCPPTNTIDMLCYDHLQGLFDNVATCFYKTFVNDLFSSIGGIHCFRRAQNLRAMFWRESATICFHSWKRSLEGKLFVARRRDVCCA